MKIVVLDGYVANNGDLSWGALEALGDIAVYDRTLPEEILERTYDADAIFTNKVVIDRHIIKQLPNLKYIGVLATGYNNVDVVAAREHGITVCNVPAYSTQSVVQNIFGHLLNITNEVSLHSRSVKKGFWQHCQDFSYRLTPIIELDGLTMGIYGLGNIGKEVAKVANAFGMKVIALTSKAKEQLPDYIKPVDKTTLLKDSDVLVLCSKLTDENYHFIDSQSLAQMKSTAIIINSSRGGMIDAEALYEALDSRRIYAAGVDVLEQEPPTHDNPLIHSARCYVTPHVGWQSDAARTRLIEISASNLKAFIEGTPTNQVL